MSDRSVSGNVLNRALVFSVGTTIFSLLELAVHSGYIHLRVLFVLTWFLFHAGMCSMLFMCRTASIRCARHMQLSAGIHVAGMYRLKNSWYCLSNVPKCSYLCCTLPHKKQGPQVLPGWWWDAIFSRETRHSYYYLNVPLNIIVVMMWLTKVPLKRVV